MSKNNTMITYGLFQLFTNYLQRAHITSFDIFLEKQLRMI
jgi:hypothetical protein